MKPLCGAAEGCERTLLGDGVRVVGASGIVCLTLCCSRLGTGISICIHCLHKNKHYVFCQIICVSKEYTLCCISPQGSVVSALEQGEAGVPWVPINVAARTDFILPLYFFF